MLPCRRCSTACSCAARSIPERKVFLRHPKSYLCVCGFSQESSEKAQANTTHMSWQSNSSCLLRPFPTFAFSSFHITTLTCPGSQLRRLHASSTSASSPFFRIKTHHHHLFLHLYHHSSNTCSRSPRARTYRQHFVRGTHMPWLSNSLRFLRAFSTSAF